MRWGKLRRAACGDRRAYSAEALRRVSAWYADIDVRHGERDDPGGLSRQAVAEGWPRHKQSLH